MARVQMVMPDADKDRYVHQAQREGMSLSAWLRAAARDRLVNRERTARITTVEEAREFWRWCDERAGPGRELDWEEYLEILNESKLRGLPQP